MEKWQKYYLKFVGGAALNASIFVGYRLYMHYLKNKLSYLPKEEFKAVQLEAYALLDFTNNLDLLELFDFEMIEDDGDRHCAFFKYKDIFILLSRYEGYPENQYTVYVDVPLCFEQNKKPSAIGQAFIEASGLHKANLVWKNEEMDQHLDLWKNQDISRAKIKAERHTHDLLKQEHIRTRVLQQQITPLPLKEYNFRRATKAFTLNFSKHEDFLSNIVFETKNDKLIACFLFNDIEASIQRSIEDESYHYSIYIEKKHIDEADKFVRGLGFRNVRKIDD